MYAFTRTTLADTEGQDLRARRTPTRLRHTFGAEFYSFGPLIVYYVSDRKHEPGRQGPGGEVAVDARAGDALTRVTRTHSG